MGFYAAEVTTGLQGVLQLLFLGLSVATFLTNRHKYTLVTLNDIEHAVNTPSDEPYNTGENEADEELNSDSDDHKQK